MSPFDSFPTSPIAIFSPDGTPKSQSKGIFGKEGITVFDASIDVDPGDYVERTLSTGKVETYTVRDTKFNEKFHSIPAHYRLLVDRKGAVPRLGTGPTVHLSGPNARFNLNSQDHSNNTVVNGSVLGDLRNAITTGVTDQAERDTLIGAIEELAAASDKSEKMGAYQRLIAAAANHMTILARAAPRRDFRLWRDWPVELPHKPRRPPQTVVDRLTQPLHRNRGHRDPRRLLPIRLAQTAEQVGRRFA